MYMDKTYLMHMLEISICRHAFVCACVWERQIHYFLCLVYGSYLRDAHVFFRISTLACVCVCGKFTFLCAVCMDQTHVMRMLGVSIHRHACVCVCVCVRVSETNSYSLCLVFGSYLCDTRVPPPNTRHACVCVWLIHDVWCLVHESDKHDAHVGFFNR